jgi:ATP-dependent 26S proteasome regulatory subunit
MNKSTYAVLWTERTEVKELVKKHEKTEEDLKAVQSVGQIVAEVLKQLDDERCGSGSHFTPSTPFHFFTPSYMGIACSIPLYLPCRHEKPFD